MSDIRYSDPEPPQCGRTVSFDASLCSPENAGRFELAASDCKAVMEELGWHHPRGYLQDDFYSWIAAADPEKTEVLVVRKYWAQSAGYVAERLVRDGKANVWCAVCNAPVNNPTVEHERSGHLLPSGEKKTSGHFYETITCQQGHQLWSDVWIRIHGGKRT